MYILYKNPIQLETLTIVQYLYYQNINLQPSVIIERKYPDFITQLPSIVYNNTLYLGLNEVIRFYETNSGIDDLLEKSINFKKTYPKYTIK